MSTSSFCQRGSDRPPRFCVSAAAILAIGAALQGAAVAATAAYLSCEEMENGFVLLFDGTSLDGWENSNKDGYVVEDGAIVCRKEGGGFLYTDKEYADFVFRFEFKLTPGSNNGLGIRTPKRVDPAYGGMELQILDNTAPVYKDLQPYQYHGSIYGVVPAKRGHLKPVGDWNSQEVVCKGKHVIVKLNGQTIVNADIEKASTPRTADGRDHPGLKRDLGHIAFCGHGARVEFRNVRVKELGEMTNVECPMTNDQ